VSSLARTATPPGFDAQFDVGAVPNAGSTRPTSSGAIFQPLVHKASGDSVEVTNLESVLSTGQAQ
jgi:hypothetical protein